MATLPTFVMIGAAKAGTSSIQEYLAEHPQIFMPPLKPNFLAFDGDGSPGDYPIRTFEAYAALYENAAGYAAVGDVSPACLGSVRAADRTAEVLPEARIIAVLRNPVERAFSGYLMQVRSGKEQRDAAEAFRGDAVFVDGGFYYERLRRFYDRFPRERIQVHLFEDFGADTLRVMQDMFAFIEVDPTFRPSVDVRHNVGFAPRNKALAAFTARRDVRRLARRVIPRAARPLARRALKLNAAPPPSVPASLRREMSDVYREDIERLQGLLDRDLSHWMDVHPSAVATAG